jgi:hypothetical protein
MTSQSTETLIIAGNEFNLSVNLLPDFLTAYKIKFDEGKDYTATWELKDNHLYLNICNAYIGNKKVVLNDLFPDLFITPYLLKVNEVTKEIEVKFGNSYPLHDYFVIQLDKGKVSHISHKQVVQEWNEFLREVKEDISQERFFELIEVFKNMSPLDREIYGFIGAGKDSDFIKYCLCAGCNENEVEHGFFIAESHRLILSEALNKKHKSQKKDEEQYYQQTGVEYKDYIEPFWHGLDENGNPLIEKKEVIQSYYHHMGGAGTISCNACGYKEDIVSFIHSFDGAGNPSDGRSGHQCQSCGKFHTIEIERAVKPYACSCSGELSRDKALFCPQCKSVNMEYGCRYIT